ncbi:UNKNOWN [Stylonychia lemnae]|uniref:Uncharacterized protein n=1 Tax=Stylonychia lemnae TaxID=5949 RepID=A0A078A6M6_STYLE|nr:UNKNOWN [Stylonychia lemnae]|eukprot:CDW77890.1 UNKNOWN [Stylonychia lemnae]
MQYTPAKQYYNRVRLNQKKKLTCLDYFIEECNLNGDEECTIMEIYCSQCYISNRVSKEIRPMIRYLLAVSQASQSEQSDIFAVIIRVCRAFKTGKTRTSLCKYIDYSGFNHSVQRQLTEHAIIHTIDNKMQNKKRLQV